MIRWLTWATLEGIAGAIRRVDLWPQAEGRFNDLVLTYHNVISDDLFDDSLHLGVSHSETAFRAHCEAVRALQADGLLPERVTFSFDDGYLNQYSNAARVLDDYGFKGLFFISFGPMLSRQPALIDRLLAFFSYAPDGEYQLLGHPWCLDATNRHTQWVKLYQLLVHNYNAWSQAELDMERQAPFVSLPISAPMLTERFTPMSPTQLCDLQQRGHRIASHGWTHLPLRSMPDDVLAQELGQTREAARAYCNSTVFAYPYGGLDEVDPRVAHACQSAGFLAAYMNIQAQPNGFPEDFAMPRTSLGDKASYERILLKSWGIEHRLKSILARNTFQ